MMSRSRTFFASLTVGIVLSAAGPAAAENVLRWASVGGALTADPHAYDDNQTIAQLRQVYEYLIGYDSNLDLVPQLATAWRLVDPTTWEFELRPNVRFHDGRPFTAADVVFSFGRAKTELPAGLAGRIESVAEVRAIDEAPCTSRPSSRTRSYGTRCARSLSCRRAGQPTMTPASP
jgi:peptide/nickel transport system substrate-binding protein